MDEPKKLSAKLNISKSGPIKVSGKFYIVDTQGNDLTPDNNGEVFLCACGNSKQKPFCDGSHKKGV